MRIERYTTLFDKLFARVNRPSEDLDVCWPWTGAIVSKGYGNIRWQGKNLSTHRVAFDECVDDIPEGMMVCHHCDNRICCRPSHLFLGTNQDNVDDMTIKDRHCFGEKNGRAKLTEIQVQEIFCLAWRDGITRQEICNQYAISLQTVWEIKTGLKWTRLNLHGRSPHLARPSGATPC